MPSFATIRLTAAPSGGSEKDEPTLWRRIMNWTTPQACDLRFGFEITMYIAAK